MIALRFGVALADDAVIRTNFMGLALSVLFLSIFYWYTPNQQKNAVWRSIGIGGAIASAVVAYAQYEREAVLASRLGLILFGLVFCLSAMPFLSLVRLDDYSFSIVCSASLSIYYISPLFRLAQNHSHQERRPTALPGHLRRIPGVRRLDAVQRGQRQYRNGTAELCVVRDEHDRRVAVCRVSEQGGQQTQEVEEEEQLSTTFPPQTSIYNPVHFREQRPDYWCLFLLWNY